jgi:hypothetical protein
MEVEHGYLMFLKNLSKANSLYLLNMPLTSTRIMVKKVVLMLGVEVNIRRKTVMVLLSSTLYVTVRVEKKKFSMILMKKILETEVLLELDVKLRLVLSWLAEIYMRYIHFMNVIIML